MRRSLAVLCGLCLLLLPFFANAASRLPVGRVIFAVPDIYQRAALMQGAARGPTYVLNWPDLTPFSLPQINTQKPLPFHLPQDVLQLSLKAAEGIAAEEKLRTLYPRYLSEKSTALPHDMIWVPFLDKSPFSGEALVSDAAMSGQLVVLCPIMTSAPLPQTCIASMRFADSVDVEIRFVQKHLSDVHDMQSAVRRLLASWVTSG